MSNAATKAVYRRWIKLIFARWLAAFHISSRGCLSLRSQITVMVRCSQKNLEDSPQSRRRSGGSRESPPVCATPSTDDRGAQAHRLWASHRIIRDVERRGRRPDDIAEQHYVDRTTLPRSERTSAQADFRKRVAAIARARSNRRPCEQHRTRTGI